MNPRSYLLEHNWTIQALREALKYKDFGTEGHSNRLLTIAFNLGKILGLDTKDLNDLCLFAYFHDLGKVLISDEILFKEGPLTEEEWVIMKQHSEIGARIASSVAELRHIPDAIIRHHERWDGKGYPDGITGEDIPLFCRIVAIADAFDAMTNDRPYRRALSYEEALGELQQNAGTQFDSELIDRFGKRIFLCP